MRIPATIAFFFIVLFPYAQNGSLQTSFGLGGKVIVDIDDLDELTCLLKDESGNTFFCGQSSEAVSGTYPFDFVIGKMDAEGDLDASFGTEGILRGDFPDHEISSISDAVWDTSGIYFIGRGNNPSVLDTNGFFIGKAKLDGTIDTDFADNGFYTSEFMGSYNTVGGIMIDSEGRIVFCGSTTHDEGTLLEYPLIGRLFQNGIPDSTFGTTGVVVWNYYDGILVDLFELPVNYLKHGEGGYLTDIAQVGNDYLVSGHFQSSALTQLHIMKISPQGEFSEEFFTPGPYVYSIKPGASHFISDMEVIEDKVYLSYTTPFSVYEGSFHFQLLDTNGLSIGMKTFDLEGYQTTVKAMEVYEGNPYVGGYARKNENDNPGYLSDDFLMLSFDQEMELIAPFGEDGIFQENMETTDELGLEDLLFNQTHFVLGGYMNNVSASNFTDLAFMAVQVDETNSILSMDSEEVKIYPNPVITNLQIDSSTPIRQISIFNTLGVLVASFSQSFQQSSIDLQTLPAGAYVIHVETEKETKTMKLLKQ